MSTEEHINQLTAQVVALQAQLAHCSWSPPPPQPSAAPPPTPKPPKGSNPPPLPHAPGNPDFFKAESSPFLRLRASQFPNKQSHGLVFLSFIKRGSSGPLATPR